MLSRTSHFEGSQLTPLQKMLWYVVSEAIIKEIAWAATLHDNGSSGGFFCDGKVVPW